jgi:hypothetical protein
MGLKDTATVKGLQMKQSGVRKKVNAFQVGKDDGGIAQLRFLQHQLHGVLRILIVEVTEWFIQ